MLHWLISFLQIRDGYLQFRYNLGSGEATARQTTVTVNDNSLHTVSLERVEQAVQLLLDGMYVARNTSPGSERTLDISRDAIYLGAMVSNEKDASDGFSGCLQGVKINRKDLPVAGETDDFSAFPSLAGVKESSCPDLTVGLGPTESTQPMEYVYSGVVGLIVLLFLLVTCFVAITMATRWWSGRKKRTHRITRTTTAGDSQSSPNALTFYPRGMRYPHPLTDTESEDFVLKSITRHHPPSSTYSTPPPSEANFSHRGLSPIHSGNPSYFKDSPSIEEMQGEPPPYYHVRSPSGHQSVGSQRSEVPSPYYHVRSPSGHQSVVSQRSEVPSSIYHDDSEVAKYVLKQVEGANLTIEETDLDEMRHYTAEGKFEPLGSIGSLYDFVAEADMSVELDQSILSVKSPPHHHQSPPPHLNKTSTHPLSNTKSPSHDKQSPPQSPLHDQQSPPQSPLHDQQSPPHLNKPPIPLKKPPTHRKKPHRHQPPPNSQSPPPLSNSQDNSNNMRSHGEPYLGEYGKKLDHLLERFHNITVHPHSRQEEESRLV